MHTLKLTASAGRGLVAVASLALLLGCGNEEERRAAEQQVQRQELAAAETTARRAATLPSDGLWTEAHLMDRLLRAGVAPRANPDAAPAAPWMQVEPIRILAGGGTIYAWVYPDSVQRRRVSETLDPTLAAPPGETSPFAPPMQTVTNNNLIVVISGGRVANHERIALAIEAGLPVIP